MTTTPIPPWAAHMQALADQAEADPRRTDRAMDDAPDEEVEA